MDLTKEAIEQIQQTAVKAAGAQVLDIGGDGRTKFFWADNKVTEVTVEPPLRAHTALCLDDLIEEAVLRFAQLKKIGGGHVPFIWHGPRGVVLVYEDDDRRDKMVFPLTVSEPLKLLVELEKQSKPLAQKDFCRMLRIKLRVEAAVVNQFRRLDWEEGKAVKGEATIGRDRLGLEIRGQVTGTAELPEELLISVPVYRERGHNQPEGVLCSLDYDTANMRIELSPLAGEIDTVFEKAQAEIRNRLEESEAAKLGVPIRYGVA